MASWTSVPPASPTLTARALDTSVKQTLFPSMAMPGTLALAPEVSPRGAARNRHLHHRPVAFGWYALVASTTIPEGTLCAEASVTGVLPRADPATVPENTALVK